MIVFYVIYLQDVKLSKSGRLSISLASPGGERTHIFEFIVLYLAQMHPEIDEMKLR